METPKHNSASASQESTQPKRPLSVLCIDDDEQVLESMEACITYLGHRVQVASGGKAGLGLFHRAMLLSKPFDVVITDLNMPDVDGYAVTREIKAESPGTPVVILSGLGALEERTKPMTAAPDAVVNKPPHLQKLGALLRRLAEGMFDHG